MERITRTDLDNMLNRYATALRRLGMNPETSGARLGLDHGSKTNGIAYRLYVTHERRPDGTRSTGHSRPPAGPDYLGMTAREAFDTLADRAATLEDVAYHQGQGGQ